MTRGADPDEAAAWWSALRRPVRESDARLTESARRWLERMPAHARPALLAARYPRIVNRIAALHGDASHTLECLDALLVDERGGRIGFVPMIRAEIVRLGYLYRAASASAPIQVSEPIWRGRGAPARPRGARRHAGALRTRRRHGAWRDARGRAAITCRYRTG